MTTLNFHRLIMGKMKICLFLLLHCRYFDEGFFIEMFVEWSSTKHTLFVQTAQFVSCHGNQKAQFAKHILKHQPLKSYLEDEAKTSQNCS